MSAFDQYILRTQAAYDACRLPDIFLCNHCWCLLIRVRDLRLGSHRLSGLYATVNNLEYLGQIVIAQDTGSGVTAYPDTLVGTDSHTTMINGIGVMGWGVGGIEAEAVMLGQPYTMSIPEVIGVRLTGAPLCYDDLVLDRSHVRDYTFALSPVDWLVQRGTWEVTSHRTSGAAARQPSTTGASSNVIAAFTA